MKFYWNDIWNFASKLTPRRFFNAFKVLLSFYLARYTQKPIQWGLPVTISFEPTTFCNLRCPECPSGLRAFTRPTGMLSTDFFSKTISELHPSLLYLYFYFQGEPYLNPNFLDMVAHAAKHKIYTVTSTNAHYLTD
ncbi:MAG TPA: radical SAM protein, partial [Chitinophagales bacterium]|nr:radical SAM protein [Chitinophagales bacterium]